MANLPTTITDELGITLTNLADAATGTVAPTLRIGVTGLSRAGKTIFITALVQFFDNNRELCAVLLGENIDKKFLAAVIDAPRDKSVREYRALFPNASRQKIEIFYYFIAWGFIGLIQQNLRHPSAFSFKTLVSSAERIITEGVQFLAEPDG